MHRLAVLAAALALGCGRGVWPARDATFVTPEELFVEAEAAYLTALDEVLAHPFNCPDARVRIEHAFHHGSEALAHGYAIERGDSVCDESRLPGCTQRALVTAAAKLDTLAVELRRGCPGDAP